MPQPEISYALPVSCLEVSGTVTETHDTILGEITSTPVATVALHTHGIDRNQVLQILTGTFRDTSLALQLTDDGLLTSADAESTGQLGKVVVGTVGVAAALASIVAPPPVAAVAAAAVGAIPGLELAFAYTAPREEEEEKEPTPDQKIAAAYVERYAEIALLRAQYASLVDEAVARIATLAEGMVAGDPVRWAAGAQIRQQSELLTTLRAELEPLDQHFATWRASTITTHATQYQRCFSLDTLRGAGVRVTHDEVVFGGNADASVRFAWDTLGVAVAMEPAGTPNKVPVETRPNAVIVRLPRRIRLSVYERVDGRPVLRQEKPYLVVDSACETQVVRFRRSLWAKRSTKLGFGDLGVLNSYAVGSTSSATALADAASQLPKTVSSNLDEADKIAKDLSANGAAPAASAKAATKSS